MKQFSQACENNKRPILGVLARYFDTRGRILEIGSGTGQHALFFSCNLPHLYWQCSDLTENHASINAWLDEGSPDGCGRPVELDVARPEHWARLDARCAGAFDGVFSANTAHIMAWEQVQAMFRGVGALLPDRGYFLLYGPFNRDGEFTSPGNAAFHANLVAACRERGLRDDRAIKKLALDCGLHWQEDVDMPANNRILVFQRIKMP